MAEEARTPLPSTAPRHQRAPMANRLQSPKSPFFLASNDDQLERSQSRVARAAAIRRKAAAAPPPPIDPGLSSEQIVELFNNCIKLASENKINQKNSWQLKLIDHLSEIIKVEAENDAETNFQKASCTLETGVKIYSARVDAVHSEAYKILSRMNQAGLEDEQEKIAEANDISGNQGKCHSKPGLDSDKKISPLSTLESSFEALNVKKFDVAFVVDPLYHRTSSLFDEGGAKGLLMNNLGTYGLCCVLFDSFEVPGKYKSNPNHIDSSDKIDLSFTKESIEQMVMNMATTTDISPTLKDIIHQLEEHSQRSLPTINLSQESQLRADAVGNKEPDFDNGIFGNYDMSSFDHCDETSALNERSSSLDSDFQGYRQDNDSYTFYNANKDDSKESIPMFWLQGLGNTLKQNAWAGPDHWKFMRSKSPEDYPGSESGPNFTKRPRNKSISDIDIKFVEFLDKEMPDIFSPPKNPKSTLLATNRASSGNKLPEDCHYQPQDIVRLFLLPNVMCLGKRRIKLSDENLWQPNSDLDKLWPSWGHESVPEDHYDNVYAHNDDEVSDGLISQPRQVNKIEVQYDKTSKQVDVHALKESLWYHMLDSNESTESVQDDTISFRHLLATFPISCAAAAAAAEDISPHLCFVCLLHLANEHCFGIHDCPGLDDLSICLPS